MSELHLEVHYSVDLASDLSPFANLCSALVELGVGPEMRVLEYERDRNAVVVNLHDPRTAHRTVVEKGCARGPLFAAIEAGPVEPRQPRRFGDVMLRERVSRTWLSVRFDEYVPAMPMGGRWLFSNSISLNATSPRIASRPAHAFIHDLLDRLAVGSDVLWGGAWDIAEYRASNLHHDGKGTWALGRDVRRSVPGLFWLNAFGSPYIELIGRSALESAFAATARCGLNLVGELYPTPGDFDTDDGRERREDALVRLGRQFFFDRNAPDADTAAPDFGLPELPSGRSLEVFTADGRTFTVIPPLDA